VPKWQKQSSSNDSLGTAILRDRHKNIPKESRNGFWLEVLRNVKAGRRVTSALPPTDAKSKGRD